MKISNTKKRLLDIMETNNLKQIDILKLCEPLCNKYDVKVTKSDLSQYLSGKTVPNQDKLFILCKALNVNEAWFIGYDVTKQRYDDNLSTTTLSYNDIVDNLNTLSNSELQNLELLIQSYTLAYNSTFDINNPFSELEFSETEDENITLIKNTILTNLDTLNYNGVSKAYSYINDLIATKLYAKSVVTLNIDKTSAQPTTISLPAYDIKASAGLGSYLDINEIPNLSTYPLNHITRKADHTLTINGNSMEPLINDGDTVFILEQPSLNNGDVGIFIYNDEIFCKRLILEHGQIILRSINKTYKDILVSEENFFKTIGKVLL